MKPPVTPGFLTTGDMGLASCLNAVGIAPVEGRALRPVKNADGSDFCQIALEGRSLDGATLTAPLMKQWRAGADGVRGNRLAAFSVLQVWNKTRAALFAMRAGHAICKGLCGGYPALVGAADAVRWLDAGTVTDFVARDEAAGNIGVGDAGLAAALVVLGADLLGVSPGGEWVMTRRSMEATPDAMECALAWPARVRNGKANAAYMACAAHNRELILKRIREGGSVLMGVEGSNPEEEGVEMWLMSERDYDAGTNGALEVARRAGV